MKKKISYLLLVLFFINQSCGQNNNKTTYNINSHIGNINTQQRPNIFSLNYLKSIASVTWSNDCYSNNQNSYVVFSVVGGQFIFPNRFAMNTNLKHISETEIEVYFRYPLIRPIPENMQDCIDYSEEILIGKFEPLGEKIKFTWYGFYNIRTEERVHTQNPFNNEEYVILEECKR